LRCPVCREKTRVIDTQKDGGFSRWRRRECTECLTRFKTFEVIEHKSLPEYIAKKTER